MKKCYFNEKDANNFISRYLSGESIESIASSANASALTIRNTMTRHGFKFKKPIETIPSSLKEIQFRGHTVYVSKNGEIFIEGKRKLRELSQWRHSQFKNGKTYYYGHRGVSIRTNKAKGTTTLVSRLVALAWIPNPKNLPLVCHKNETLDENGFLDNSADNLYWGTYIENTTDAVRKRRTNVGEKHPKSKLTDVQREEIRNLYKTGNYTQAALGVIYGAHNSTISYIIRGK